VNLHRFLDEYFKSHGLDGAMREAFEAGVRDGYAAAHAQPMPQQPFPSGRCANCGKPLDDHKDGRCP
jgi:hypothetical protein